MKEFITSVVFLVIVGLIFPFLIWPMVVFYGVGLVLFLLNENGIIDL